jgi:DNA-directed RNA polymerase specialized sigma subunit
MTIQEVKNYLSQAYYIDKRVITLQDELTMLESKLERCTASYTSIRGGGSQPTFEYNLDKVMKYREMLNHEIDNLIERKRNIKQTIAKLDNDKERLILYKKYINFQTFESIADDLDITPRQVYKIYKKSLENLQEFIEVQY